MSKYVRTLDDYKKAMSYRMSEEEVEYATVDLEIANAIRKARNEKHLSQREFAAMIGVAPALLNRWESGKSNFQVHTLVLIASLLGCDFVCPLKISQESETQADDDEAVSQTNSA